MFTKIPIKLIIFSIAFSDRSDEFRKLGADVIACSCDSHFSHLVKPIDKYLTIKFNSLQAWVNTSREDGGLGKMYVKIVKAKVDLLGTSHSSQFCISIIINAISGIFLYSAIFQRKLPPILAFLTVKLDFHIGLFQNAISFKNVLILKRAFSCRPERSNPPFSCK
jgi:hypothetical protein